MTQTYLVLIDRDAADPPVLGDDVVELDDGLYLVRTQQTRSELYHSVKRRLSPAKLLVAPLAALPKFKGMKPGATTHARRLS